MKGASLVAQKIAFCEVLLLGQPARLFCRVFFEGHKLHLFQSDREALVDVVNEWLAHFLSFLRIQATALQVCVSSHQFEFKIHS